VQSKIHRGLGRARISGRQARVSENTRRSAAQVTAAASRGCTVGPPPAGRPRLTAALIGGGPRDPITYRRRSPPCCAQLCSILWLDPHRQKNVRRVPRRKTPHSMACSFRTRTLLSHCWRADRDWARLRRAGRLQDGDISAHSCRSRARCRPSGGSRRCQAWRCRVRAAAHQRSHQGLELRSGRTIMRFLSG